MRAEIHYKLNFSKEIDYKQFLVSFLLKGWEIFPKNGENIIIDIGNDDDFITVDNQDFFYEILKHK